jgi:hydroxyacylglutathione hydrolase
MKLYFHFSLAGFSNTYIIGPDESGDAIIVDPGTMDVGLLETIESNGYYVRNALLTHAHASHASGLKTLRKIYEVTIYAATERVLDFDCVKVAGGETLDISGFEVGAIDIQGHSADSLIYTIGSCMFTGDAFSAGTVGSAPTNYARELLTNEIKTRILGLDTNYLIFPGHGSPSTLEAERLINPALAEQ